MVSSAADFVKDKLKFFKALERQDPVAIRYLSDRLSYSIKSLPGVYHFLKEDIEELKNDALLILLKKITNGEFVYQEYDPLSYALAVSRRLFANLVRKKRLNTVPVEDYDQAADFSPDEYLHQKEMELKLGTLLSQVGENCEKILRLKYYDNLKDQKIVDRNLAPYTSVDSLKNKRSQCLKKLSQIVKSNGVSLTDFFK